MLRITQQGMCALPSKVRGTRINPDTHRSVTLELWALPKHQVGDFMAGIPAPLGIGTLVLSDQRQVQGFLCESAGIEGARDISELGNWRVFLQSA